MTLGLRDCPVCASRYTTVVQKALGRRTRNTYVQHVCLDCLSFFHRSGYVESDEQKQLDLDMLMGWRDIHQPLQSQLMLEVLTRVPHVRTVCDIGHGAGYFLTAARDYGRIGHGFEVNQKCHEYARDQLGLDVSLGMFSDAHEGRYDLISAIMVFEHLEQPRALFSTMRDHLNPDGAIYLSVPFAHREEWPYLWTAGSNPADAPPDIFYDNDVHITHFSVQGMRRMGLGLGARHADYFVSKDTAQNSPGAYHGVLFRF